MTTEPVAIAGAIQGLISAVIALTIAFGWWTPTDTQIAAVMALYTALVAVLTVAARAKSTPNSKLPTPAPVTEG